MENPSLYKKPRPLHRPIDTNTDSVERGTRAGFHTDARFELNPEMKKEEVYF